MNEPKGGQSHSGSGQDRREFKKPQPGKAHGGQRRDHGGAPPASAKALPMPRPINYFRDGKLLPELLDREAERVARQLDRVSTSQLRRFYEDVLNLRRRLAAEHAWEALRADFKMLKAKAVYANGRSERTFPREFLQFFIDHVEAVKTARDFEAFCKHFQAVVAFHKFYGRED